MNLPTLRLGDRVACILKPRTARTEEVAETVVGLERGRGGQLLVRTDKRARPVRRSRLRLVSVADVIASLCDHLDGELRDLMMSRRRAGLEVYGTTLRSDRFDHDRALREAAEESADCAAYRAGAVIQRGEDPASDAGVVAALGLSSLNLGDTATALESLRRAVALLEES